MERPGYKGVRWLQGCSHRPRRILNTAQAGGQLRRGGVPRLKVIDYLASDLADLLRQLDGQRFAVVDGSVTLGTAGAELRLYPPDWRMRLLPLVMGRGEKKDPD